MSRLPYCKTATVAAIAASPRCAALPAAAVVVVIGLISCCYGKKVAIKATGNGEMSSGSVGRDHLALSYKRPFVHPRPGPGLSAKQTLLGRAFPGAQQVIIKLRKEVATHDVGNDMFHRMDGGSWCRSLSIPRSYFTALLPQYFGMFHRRS